jgi:hypothetical protein
MIFSRSYLRVFVPLAILFAIYNLTFVPWLDSARYVGQKKWSTDILGSDDEWWNSFFKEDSWQRQSPQVLTTEQGTLLYQHREEITETKWKIYPLTILVPQSSSGSTKRAILISNPEGAEIQFQRRPEWTSEPPPVESGLLLGKILLYAPPDNDSSDNGLQIETSGVRIDRRRIWTDKSIKMQMGDSLIEGHHLTILLENKLLTEETQKKTDHTPFDGLENLELIYVDRVSVGLKQGGLWPSDRIPDIRKRPAHATLKCGGRFLFDFRQSEATLFGGVRMEHRVEGLPIDTFECEELHMQIGFHNDPAPVAPATPGGPNKRSPWKLEKLKALGALGRTPMEAPRWLKLMAPGMMAEASGLHLHMDFISGEMSLSNTLPLMASRDSSPVFLRRENIQVWSPEILYRNEQILQSLGTSQKTTTTPRRLGAIVASGPGTAQLEDGAESWRLSWGKRLLVRESGEMDLVTIDGSANIRSETQGSFVANQLRLWLRPVDNSLSAKLKPHYRDGKVPSWIPDLLDAEHDVSVDTLPLRAKVDKLVVKFEHTMTESAISTSPTASSPASITMQPPTLTNVATDSANAGLTQFESSAGMPSLIRQPNNPITSNPITSNPSPTFPSQIAGVQSPRVKNNPTGPYNVTAKSLQASMRMTGDQANVDGLSLDGNFVLTKEMLSESSPWPFTATGASLRLAQTSPDAANVHLVGTPAKVAVGSGWVTAPELQLSQSDHQFWINHPGELVIPAEAIPLQDVRPNASLVSAPVPGLPFTPNRLNSPKFPSTNSDNPSLTKWHSPPKLLWGERMTFDGRTARFGGGVSLTCQLETAIDSLWHIAVHSKSMTVNMAEPVDFVVKSNGPPQRAEVASIQFENDPKDPESNVDIKVAQTDRDRQLNRKSLDHIKIPRLDVFVPTQTFLGYGPGELWSRRKSSPLAVVGAPTQTTTTSQSKPNLQCLHLLFMGRIEGDMITRKVSFFDKIDALLGPIGGWDDQVNVHYAERLSKNQTRLLANQLNLFDGRELMPNNAAPYGRSPNDPAWEIEAVSKVILDSETDQGLVSMSGDSLKYVSLNDTVHIAGSPQAATITHPGSGGNMQFSNFSMQLKTGAIKGNIRSIETNLPQNMQRATPNNAIPGSTSSRPKSALDVSPRDIPLNSRGR